MTELYQGQHAGDVIARKQVKEMKKEIERMKAESAQYRELYQGQKAGDELARKQNKEMKRVIERMKKEADQSRKENDQIKEEAAQNRKRYEEEKKNSALRLHEDGMDIDKIAGILNAEPAQINEWVVRENEQKYNA